jgi:hypothetical protein
MLKATKTSIFVIALGLSPLLTARIYALDDYTDECMQGLPVVLRGSPVARCQMKLCMWSKSLLECTERLSTNNPCTEEEWEQVWDLFEEAIDCYQVLAPEGGAEEAPPVKPRAPVRALVGSLRANAPSLQKERIALYHANQQHIRATLNAVHESLRFSGDAVQTACALPDLFPEPKPGTLPPSGLCRLDADNNLMVRVKNQGGTATGASTLRVTFYTDGPAVVDIPTPPLDGGASVDLTIPFPGNGCFAWDCTFHIAVDVDDDVVESDEVNNNAEGLCIG